MLLQKIQKWFYNHYSPPEWRYVKFIQRWSTQNTYYHMCQDEVMLEAQKMAGAPPDSQAFLGCLQDVTTKLWKQLSPGNQQVYANLAKKWSNEFLHPISKPGTYHVRYMYASHVSLIEWQVQWAQKSSMTFSCKYLKLAVSAALLWLHIWTKMAKLLLSCMSSNINLR